MRLGVWLLGLSLLAAQELPSPPGAPAASPLPEAKSGDLCTVEGTVLNARTKAPLAKATVRLIGMGAPAARQNAASTDVSGKFKLEGVQPGEYRALASRSGFVRQVFGSGKGPASLTLAPQQTLTGLTLELSPGAVIAGHVVDQDGEPLANVQIQPFRYVNSQGSRELVPSGRSASTDDRGAYRLFDLDSGRYLVSAAYTNDRGAYPLFDPDSGRYLIGAASSARAVSAGGANPAGAPNEGAALAFYPGVVDPSQAAPIQLHAGEERGDVDFRIAPTHGIRVRGRLTPAPERPQEVIVAMAPLGGGVAGMFASGPRPPARIDSSGAFEFRGVTPGSYLLTATWNRDGNALRGRLPVEAASSDIDGLDLPLKPAVEVKGRVRFDGDSHPDMDLKKMTVTLMPAQPVSGTSGPRRTEPDAGGSFRFASVFEGDYLLRIGAPNEDAYVKSVTYGGADASGKPLSLGGAPGTLELVLAVDGGEVQGTVTDGDKPAAGALVAAEPESGREDLARAGRSDSSGRFTIRGLAPGDYTIYAFDDPPEGSGADPDGAKAYRDKGKKITVQERTRTSVDLALIHTQDE